MQSSENRVVFSAIKYSEECGWVWGDLRMAVLTTVGWLRRHERAAVM